ncbi:MAG: hypothetical protein K2X91_02460, partial [Thermoleophilia bacterium]|nr:hypothetical protein [Thermoleophilia bacterium]
GQCARRVFFANNEDDAVYGRARDGDHEDRWGARVRGSVYEAAWWVPALRRAYGDRLLWVGDDQVTLADEYLSATPDGLLTGCAADALAHLGISDIGGDCLLLECKTADPRTRLDVAKPEHVYQVQVQLGLVRLLTPHRPGFTVISYTDTSFWDEVREFPVAFDPQVFATARERARAIMTARSADEIRPEGIVAGGRECDLCPFTTACGRARAARVPERADPLDEETASAVADLAGRIRAGRAAVADLERETRALEQALRDAMAEVGSRRAEAGGFRVTWSAVKGRPAYDHKAIREAAAAAGVDIERFVTTGDPTDRLVIIEIPAPAGADAACAA